MALDALHGVEGDVAFLPDLEDRDDVGVVQPRGGLGLAAEPLQRLAVGRHVGGQDFQGHPTAEGDLLGLVDHAHAAAAELAHDPVIAELAQERDGGLLPEGVVAGVALDLLDLDQGREHLADLVGHLGQAVRVLLDARPLAAAIPIGELLGQLVEPAVARESGGLGIFGGLPTHRESSASRSLSRFRARKYRLAAASWLMPSTSAASARPSCSKCLKASTSRSIASR